MPYQALSLFKSLKIAAFSKQKGAALILIAFILGLGAAAYLLNAYNAEAARIRQDEKTYQALKEAKVALIAWAVSHPNVPGMMPWPDRNTDTDFDGDSAYDGKSDCVTTAFQYGYLLGQLPWRSQSNPCVNPQTGLGQDFRDGQGNHLWYAVSRNMIYDYEHSESPIINPGMINPPHAITPYMRQSGTQSYPWLKVLDRSGNLVSDRVAAVIIAPGSPLQNQNRSSPAPNASEFLDSFKIGAANYKNSDSSLVDEDFIIGENSLNVPDSDTTFVKPYSFNDKLVYITIDELIYALEKRVLEEAKNSLNKYFLLNGYYPYAAGLGLTTNQNECIQGNLRGLLPVNIPSSPTCKCTSSNRTCSCNFSIVSSISFTRNTGNFIVTGGGANAPVGACVVNSATANTCTCNGEGKCMRSDGAIQFSCDACGQCTATVAGVNKFNTTGTFTTVTGSCTKASNQISCSNALDGTFTLGACAAIETVKSMPTASGLLPPWFTANQWQKYIVYAVSNNCTSAGNCMATTSPPKLTIGVNNNLNAIVASSINAPTNSVCNIDSYLSSAENTNIVVSNGSQDFIYQKTEPRLQGNTDQVVPVLP